MLGVQSYLELNYKKQLTYVYIFDNQKLIKTKFYFKTSHLSINAKTMIYCMLVNYMMMYSIFVKKINKFLIIQCYANKKSPNLNTRMQFKNLNNRYLTDKSIIINKRLTTNLINRPAMLDYQYLPVTSQTTLIYPAVGTKGTKFKKQK